MVDADHVRLERIVDKLAAVRAMPELPKGFGVAAHGFTLAAPASQAVVAEFEQRHEVTLPEAYRLFVTELGDGGAGPGSGLRPLRASCCAHSRSVHLAQASPYLPGGRYPDDWQQRYEDPPDTDRIFLRGTLELAGHGCTLATRLVVTGPARGRLFNLDYDGIGPYILEDADFLAWYERWLDESVAGYDVGWFGERLPLDEPQLLATLAGDTSPARRARAGTSLLQLPAVSQGAWSALIGAVDTDVDAAVRAELWEPMRWQHHQPERRLDNPDAIADDIAAYARSCTPPDLAALAILHKLTITDILPQIADGDLERRRRAAGMLAQPLTIDNGSPPARRDDVVRGLLSEPDPLLRSHAIAAVTRFRLSHLHPLLSELHETETDPWVRFHLRCRLAQRPTSAWDDLPTPASQERIDRSLS